MPARTEIVYEAIAAIGIAVLIFLAASVAGFLGVGILGLLMMGIAFRAGLHITATSPIYYPPRERIEPAEQAELRHEADQLRVPILMGKLLGLALAVIGFSGLVFG